MDKEDMLVFTEKPELRNPSLVCGINGWVDGGESATGSVRYLAEKLGAKKFAEIPIGEFHIYQLPGQLSLRPHIKVQDGVLKEHIFPKNEFFYWRNPGGEKDLILFLGTEPNLHWEEYAGTILTLAEEFSVERIYLLGGVLDSTPHRKEPNVSCSCSSPELNEAMEEYGVTYTSYEGPGRFGTTLLYICQQKHLELASFTARVTYYPEFNIIVARNPKAIRAIVKRLKGLLRLNLDLSDLDEECEDFEGKLDFLASQNQELKTYIEELEKDYVEIEYDEPLELSADEAVQIAEELLKRKPED